MTGRTERGGSEMDPLQRVMEERARQDAKWGEQNHADLYWLAILTEELGEAAKELIEGRCNRADKELVEVAAVALAWLECRERARARDKEAGRTWTD
jgi:hypothetical protein